MVTRWKEEARRDEVHPLTSKIGKMDVFILTRSGKKRAMTSSAADLLSCSNRDGGRNNGPRDQCMLVVAGLYSIRIKALAFSNHAWDGPNSVPYPT